MSQLNIFFFNLVQLHFESLSRLANLLGMLVFVMLEGALILQLKLSLESFALLSAQRQVVRYILKFRLEFFDLLLQRLDDRQLLRELSLLRFHFLAHLVVLFGDHLVLFLKL